MASQAITDIKTAPGASSVTPSVAVGQPAWASLERVAWVRAGALGDLVVGLASLVELPSFFPRARITVIGPKQWLEVLSPTEFPFVERIAVVERRGAVARIVVPRGDSWAASGEPDLPVADLLARCDGVVNTNIDSLRYGFAAFKARVRVRVGSAPAPYTWLYTHSSPFFGKDPLVHERDAALLILERATSSITRHFASINGNRARLPEFLATSPLIKKWRERGLPQAKKPNLRRAEELTSQKSGSYLLFNPTASRREKTWPSERMRGLIEALQPELSRQGIVPMIIGAPSETAWLSEVAGKEYGIVQPRDLGELQDVVAGARALIANASSMQFVAGTTQTPVLTIFGRGQPVIWGPVGRHDRFVRAKFGGAEKGQTFAGLEEEARIYRTIEVDEVAAEVRALLADTMTVNKVETR